MIFGLMIPADTNTDVVLVMMNGKLLEMQTVVGGYIEVLQTAVGNLIVNEEGLLSDLPLNPIATCLRSGITAVKRDNLRGAALLLGKVDEEGNFTDVTPDGVAKVMAAMRDVNDLKDQIRKEVLGDR